MTSLWLTHSHSKVMPSQNMVRVQSAFAFPIFPTIEEKQYCNPFICLIHTFISMGKVQYPFVIKESMMSPPTWLSG